MKVSQAMIQAARRAEYDHYQKGRALGSERFIPTPDDVIRSMLEAALAVLTGEPPPVAREKANAGSQEAVPTAMARPGRRLSWP